MRMNLYGLYNSDGDTEMLVHTNKYSDEEFEKMCKEAPLGGLKYDCPFYSERKIKEYLIEKYGFKEYDFTSLFFLDEKIK